MGIDQARMDSLAASHFTYDDVCDMILHSRPIRDVIMLGQCQGWSRERIMATAIRELILDYDALFKVTMTIIHVDAASVGMGPKSL